jgi:hypothetical protein
MHARDAKIVFWHRELPPLEAGLVAEHTGEATSSRVQGTLAHRDEAIDPKHDDAAGEAWLHGRFSYMLYRRPLESR